MGILSGLIALWLLAADEPKPSAEPLRQAESLRAAGATWEAFWLLDQPSDLKTQADEGVTYQVTVLDMESIGWRSPIYHRLKMAGQQGQAMIWTTDLATARALKKRTRQVTAAPRVTATPGGSATITLGPGTRYFVSNLNRQANGPLHHASAIAFRPDVGKLNDRTCLRLSSERVEGVSGLMVRVDCDATWVTAMHTVSVPETYVDDEGIEAGTLNNQVQVPEVAACDLKGTWRVPAGEALVLSLGAHSVIDPAAIEKGLPVENAIRIQERLLLVEFNPGRTATSTSTASQPAVESKRMMIRISPNAAARFNSHADTANLPMPATPTRGLPSTGPNETLPPLPDEATKPAAFSPSAEPRPSPQSPHVSNRPQVDRNTQKASATSGCQADACCGSPAARPSEWTAVRSSVMRIPLGGNLAIEIRATVAPAPKSQEESR